ncbi:unnamed protein product [Scytosiphon promiscuus]
MCLRLVLTAPHGGDGTRGHLRRQPDARVMPRPPVFLLFFLLVFVPNRGESFVFPGGGGGSSAGSRGRRDVPRWGRGKRAAGHGPVVAIIVGGTARTGGDGAMTGAGAGSGAHAPGAGATMSGATATPLDGRRRRIGERKVVAGNLAAVSPHRSGPTAANVASRPSLRTMAAAAAAEAGVPHGKRDGTENREEDEDSVDRVPDAGELLAKARDLYNDVFGPPKDVQNVCAGYAPGRVNLIGEHTDYNGGFVMPLALERGTVVYGVGRLVDAEEGGSKGSGGRGSCRVVSGIMSEEAPKTKGAGEEGGAEGEGEGSGTVCFDADASLSPGEPEWANYVKGVVKEFMAKVPEGKRLEFTVTVVGAVPIGGGVSSSASLTVAMGTFLQGVLSSAGITPPSHKEKAHLCRMAEHNFLDMPCGIMDQFVTSMALPGHAMLLDCRSEEPDAVPLSDPDLVIVVTNSNVKHKLAGSQYPVRVAQCQAARDELQKSHPDVQLLRDATLEQVSAMEGQVEDAVFRRARHVVTENDRTVAAAQALKKGDYSAVGRLMVESHRSLREDYEVSCSELDALVELAMEVDGVFGSRMTGGGFGGCTVTLVKEDSVESLISHLREGYSRDLGQACTSFVTKPGFGSRGLTGAAAATGTKWPEQAS